ncbi:MAG: sensor histidine kinase, partial [Myxococcales bacterium]
RTPLQALTVSASLLDRIGPLTGAQLRAVARVTSRVQHLQRILWDLLDFTRERLGGGLPVERRTIDVFALVLGLVDDYRAAWPERELHCFCEGDGHGSFDPDRVLQLLTNLLNNALTWGDPDAPIELLAQQEGTSIRIRVTNRGATIPPELMDRLFVPFAASRPAPGGSRHRGLGLGLFIARQIASAHGGTLTARSENGATEFTAVLPTRG